MRLPDRPCALIGTDHTSACRKTPLGPPLVRREEKKASPVKRYGGYSFLACLLVVWSSPARADDSNSESKRWRYFFRETQFNQLLLDLAAQHRPQSIILRGATVLTMRGDEPLLDHAVVVENGRISRVAPSKDVPVRGDYLEIDARGKFVTPGLVDMHVHTLTTAGHYLLDLARGVTSVREMAGFPWLLALRESVRDNKVLVPNLYLTGTILNGFEMEWYAVVVKKPDQARELVRRQKAEGYDFIKIHNVLRPDCYDAVAEECRKLDIDLVGHIPHDISLAKAIASGQRTFEHLKGYYSDRTLELSKEDRAGLTRDADVWNCPTLYTHRIGLRGEEVMRLLEKEEAKYLSSDEKAEWRAAAAESGGDNHRKIRTQSLHILKELLPVQPKLLVGTDSGGGYPMMVPGFAMHEEMRLLVEASVSPKEVLHAATINAAQAMRREQEFGSIAAGLRADLLLLDGDPRDDVAALSGIRGVCVRGVWLDRAALDDMLRRLREIFADDQQLDAAAIPDAKRIDALMTRMTELESAGAIQMDHNLRELRELLAKHKRSTDAVDAILAKRKSD